jgi:ribose-phosphate pyrophosphokinase
MKTLIAHPRFDYLADEIVKNNPKYIRKWQTIFGRFPDDTPDLEFQNVKKDIEHEDVTYIWDFSQMSETFEHYNTLFNLVKNTANKVRIIMPFFPVWTSERVEKKGKTETAHAYAHLFSHLPSGRREKNSVHIFDIHALVEQSLFDIDTMNAELHTTTSLLRLKRWEMIVFPDDGAAKRFREYFPGVPESRRIICAKERVGKKRIITLKEGNPEWKNVVIVDDLIQTGGTIREAAKMLRAKWARSVRAFAPHGVFPNDSHIKLAGELDELIVTDSIPINIERSDSIANMRVLSIAPLVERIIRGR